MPGSSLWLCPPPTSPLHAILTRLIRTTIPSRFPDVSNPPVFPPHITITSDTIPPQLPGGSSPADWLRAELEPILPAARDLHARFCGLDSETFFFRRLTIRVQKDGGVAELARRCREKLVEGGNVEAAQKWVDEAYRPHLSLLYADTTVSAEQLEEIKALLFSEGLGLDPQGDGLTGFEGGKILLVPTYKPVHEWEPLAEIELK